jgi:hypothetical protein
MRQRTSSPAIPVKLHHTKENFQDRPTSPLYPRLLLARAEELWCLYYRGVWISPHHRHELRQEIRSWAEVCVEYDEVLA